jgi:MFS family permease
MVEYNAESRYRWLILAVATLGLVISNGLAIGGIPVFSKPIQSEFMSSGVVASDGAQSFIANASGVTFLMSGIFSFVGGWMLRWTGLRWLMVIGCIVLGAGFVIHSQAESVGVVYLSRFLIGASLGFVGVTPSVVLVSRWFGRKKGTALGVLLTGTSIGGFVMPVVFAALISRFEWRLSMMLVSGLVWLVLLPLVVFLVREPVFGSLTERLDSEGLTLQQAVATKRFWLFAASAALVFYTIFVTTQQFILYLQSPEIGLSLGIASWWQSILFALSVTGKSMAGLLSDRFPSERITIWSTGMMFVSTLILLLAGAPFVFLVIYGLGYGATFVLLQRLVGHYFGRRDYERILGTITMFEIFGGVAGGRVTGYLADRAGGDYTSAFYVMIAVTAAAFFLMLVLNKRPGAAS